MVKTDEKFNDQPSLNWKIIKAGGSSIQIQRTAEKDECSN